MKYRGYLLATAGGMAAASGAQAADLPMKAPMLAAPAASWEGWYVGLNAGAAWQHSEANGMGYNELDINSVSGTSFIGGGQIGYNWQHGTFVYGWEADISGLAGSAKHFASKENGALSGIDSKIRWLSTVRGRAGLAVADTMVYATAGLAFGGVKNSFTATCPACVPNVKSESKTKVGWALGGGVEHMWTRNWTVGLEALWVDLGNSTAHDLGGAGKTTKFSNQAVIGRVKVNYRF